MKIHLSDGEWKLMDRLWEDGPATITQLTHALEVFLKGLSSRDRDLFLCRYWYLASIREIAQAFRLPENRVKVILFRTRNKLKIYLEQEGFL